MSNDVEASISLHSEGIPTHIGKEQREGILEPKLEAEEQIAINISNFDVHFKKYSEATRAESRVPNCTFTIAPKYLQKDQIP